MRFYSKNAIRKAGHVFAGQNPEGDSLLDALEKVNYWREIHTEPLERLLSEAESLAQSLPETLIAGRLKKQRTIIDKLQREDNVKDLDTMYDIAGCRIVVESPSDLQRVVERALKSPFCDIERTKDYIAHPKKDGYRGVHVIYRYDDLDCGHTLRAELQIRTEQEHAWATAVEMYDAAARTRLKFENDNSVPFWFFKRASAVIESVEAGKEVDVGKIRSMGNDLSSGRAFIDVVDLLKEANNAAFLTSSDFDVSVHDYCLIDFEISEQVLHVARLASDSAVETYFRAENKLSDEGHDVVLTKGFSMDGLRRLYPNYFGNIDPFIHLIEKHMVCFY